MNENLYHAHKQHQHQYFLHKLHFTQTTEIFFKYTARKENKQEKKNSQIKTIDGTRRVYKGVEIVIRENGEVHVTIIATDIIRWCACLYHVHVSKYIDDLGVDAMKNRKFQNAKRRKKPEQRRLKKIHWIYLFWRNLNNNSWKNIQPIRYGLFI